MKVYLIDYGMGNLLSIENAFTKCGAEIEYIKEPIAPEKINHLILPGVGAFADGMEELSKRGFTPFLKEYFRLQKPLIGICLGMQMLFDSSSEFGEHSGLGFIPGKVLEIPNTDSGGHIYKRPFIGWSELNHPNPSKTHFSRPILKDVPINSSMYFVHSYYATETNPDHLVAYTTYGDAIIPAIVQKDLTVGCQFHPEKSAAAGLQIIKNFLTF